MELTIKCNFSCVGAWPNSLAPKSGAIPLSQASRIGIWHKQEHDSESSAQTAASSAQASTQPPSAKTKTVSTNKITCLFLFSGTVRTMSRLNLTVKICV